VRSSWLLLVATLVACGSPTVVPDGGAPGDAGVDAGVTADAGSTTDAGLPDAGAVVSTTLRVKYPAGTRSVSVRGSVAPFSWTAGLPMQQLDAETWVLSVSAAVGDFEWKPLLDDQVWSKGPNYRGRQGTTTEVAPRFFRDAGEWSKRWPSFASTILGNTRGVYVYLPPTYLENAAARFPVVYMHDGQNLFDPAVAFGGVTWRVAETMDAAASDGRFREAIVIGAENAGAGRIAEYTPTADPGYGGGDGDDFLRMMAEELKPLVDAELRTKPGREDTVILGSSLGGLISSYAGVKQPNTWGLIGAMSPSVWWDNEVILSVVATTGTTRPLKVWVDSGDSGASNDGVDGARRLAAAYRALGYVDDVTLVHVVQQGATHTESAWATRLPWALQFLLGPGR
jgi:predicted alpha/beta superfamily hydrolase